MVSMNQLNTKRRAQVIAALVEGCSIRSTSRMTGTSKNTVIKLLEDVGAACSNYQDEVMRNLPCRLIQCDEIWSFCHSKEKSVSPKHEGILGYSDVRTWTAMESETKLVPCWHVGRRVSEVVKPEIDKTSRTPYARKSIGNIICDAEDKTISVLGG